MVVPLPPSPPPLLLEPAPVVLPRSGVWREDGKKLRRERELEEQQIACGVDGDGDLFFFPTRAGGGLELKLGGYHPSSSRVRGSVQPPPRSSSSSWLLTRQQSSTKEQAAHPNAHFQLASSPLELVALVRANEHCRDTQRRGGDHSNEGERHQEELGRLPRKETSP